MSGSRSKRATKFVMKGTAVDCKNRLMYLHLLPLMMEREITDILFFVKSLKFPSEHFNIRKFVKFCDNPIYSFIFSFKTEALLLHKPG